MHDTRTSTITPALTQPSRVRRRLLGSLLLGGLYCRTGWAQQRLATPAQTEGPFYPDQLPLDQDNDLVFMRGRSAPAQGELTQLSGQIRDSNGHPLRGVTVEIWQVDQHGHYIHSGDAGSSNDPGFQGYGRFETGQDGQYRFRTIKPVPYPGRTPHIHVKLHKGGRPLLTTQLYVQGHRLNARDAILHSLSPQQQALVVQPFVREASGTLRARFDIVLGSTPQA